MKQPGLLESWPAVQEFLFAGNAIITLKSLKTDVRFTYKVRVKKEDAVRLEQEEKLRLRGVAQSTIVEFRPQDVVYFVNLLRGPDNTADFAYMGVLRQPGRFFYTAASGKVSRVAPSYKALLWMLDALQCDREGVLGRLLEVWHEGRCGRCGRLLTVPDSIRVGLGPECQRVLGPATGNVVPGVYHLGTTASRVESVVQ